ncbi:MAG: hypothetical protein NT166_10905 [Candidatus Aminicenantes bacterium]|nr:hypothetical protein [Candidatus Aminicenantes bacterium]
MEDKKLKEEMLNEAVRIGDWLLEKAKNDSSGRYWECVSMDMERNITWDKGAGIYSGVSGISLFLLMLHKITRHEKYLSAAKDGMQWALDYCRKNPGELYSFFTGRMGVPYVLLKMAEFTGESKWTENALELARPCTDSLNSPQPVDDLINGASGNIIGLLHLHAAAGEKWLLDAVELFAKHLIHSAYQGPKGLYWDRSHNTISGLCGFSHGAAGIGWVFLELAHYFQNETFYRLAQQAFLYESCFFDDAMKNWQDLRKGTYTPEDEEAHRKAFLENNIKFFTGGGDMNAWCHGAAGIGLSRLRAYELFKDINTRLSELYRNDAAVAIEKTIATDLEMKNPNALFILCHGSGGNAELFLKAYETFNDEKYLALAEKVARKALDSREKLSLYLSGYRGASTKGSKEEEDTSLFMGNAGIGYFYLRVLAPHDIPSILIPRIDAVASPSQTFPLSLPEAGKELLKKYFSRTIAMAEKYRPRELADFFSNNPLDIHRERLGDMFMAFMDKTLAAMPPREQNCLSDVLILEREKVKMDEAIPSHSYLEIKDKVLNEQARKLAALDGDAFLNLKLILEPTVKIATTEWDWSAANEKEWLDNISLEEDIFPLLLKPTPLKILEEPLSPMTYTILGGFEGGNTVESVRLLTIDAFETLTPEQERMLTEKIIEQIKQALLAGILIPILKEET